MVKNIVLIIRVTKNQRERIEYNAEAKGYKTLSSYIRAVTLEQEYDGLIKETFERKEREKNTELKSFIKL